MTPRGMSRRSSSMIGGDHSCGASLMKVRNSSEASGASWSTIVAQRLAAAPEREAHAALDALRHRIILALEHGEINPGAEPDVRPVPRSTPASPARMCCLA